MTSTQARHSTSDPGEQRPRFERPRFNSQITSDRLAEGSRFVSFVRSGKICKGRKSVFREMGLDGDDVENAEHSVRRQSFEEKQVSETTRRVSESAPERKDAGGGESTREQPGWLSKLIPEKRPKRSNQLQLRLPLQ
ncbi:hypothetical protein F4824DRAFT_461589 [Ustulina deusta]|nr:hypothetical protein F4824DRAFT_461589 [Ustulina deusta]